MQNICDEERTIYPTDGTAAVAVGNSIPVIRGKKKSRRKNKINAVTYAADTENSDTLAGNDPGEIYPEDAAVYTEPADIQSGVSLGEGITTDIGQQEEPVPSPQTEGIMYEVAQELYRREKTQAELEALCQPPFHRNFTEGEKCDLDRQSAEQTRQMLNSASEKLGEPTFLPEGLYDERDKPISTAAAFSLMILLLVPGVNIISAIYYSFSSSANRNKRAIGRAFLSASLVLMGALLILLTVYFFRTELNRPGSAVLSVWRRFFN